MRLLPILIIALFLAGCASAPSKQVTVPLPPVQYSDP